MGRKKSNVAIEVERKEQYERGQRIKKIREEELKMNKTQLAREIGTSSQFLGFVEDGKGNLVYYSLRKLREVSGHSADYILFGLDDTCINKTKKLLKDYSEEDIIESLNINCQVKYNKYIIFYAIFLVLLPFYLPISNLYKDSPVFNFLINTAPNFS